MTCIDGSRRQQKTCRWLFSEGYAPIRSRASCMRV